MEKNEYKKKMKLYESFGALKFQKLLFLIEKIKYKVLKKLCPNFIYYFDKYCDWKEKKRVKHAKTEKEIKRIKKQTKKAKMAMRQEWNEEKNRNYHMNPKKPTEIVAYLEWNKNIHKKGLITNAVLIPICIAGVILQIPVSLPLLIAECFSAFINFECINIQNYNLCRVKQILPMLKRKEENLIKKEDEEVGEAAKIITKSVEKSESLPTFDEILSNIQTEEQLRQMKELFRRSIEERQIPKVIGQKTT